MNVMGVEIKMNIPNALSLVRIVLLPVFATLYLMSNQYSNLLYWSFGVLLLSGITDSLDGIIARKFNQITELGKILDPVADKLTQVTVVLCLAVRSLELIPLLIICFAKELIQGTDDKDAEESDLIVKKVSVAEFEKMIERNEIKDSGTLSAWCLAKAKKFVH